MVIERFGGPEEFKLSEMVTPELKKDELLIETISSSVNPVDWKQRGGSWHKYVFRPKFPLILGYDVAGKVIQTGKEVTTFNTGDYVCGILPTNYYGGALAEFAKGTEKCFVKIDESPDTYQFGILPLTGLTAFQALRDKGRLQEDQSVLIIGAAGGVGNFALQVAHIFKARTYAVSSERHKSFIEELAPEATFIDYRKEDILKTRERFKIIYDTAGAYSFRKCMHLLVSGGIYINTLPRPKILMHKVISVFTQGKKVMTQLVKHDPVQLRQLVKWVGEGKIRLCIDREFSVIDIANAHRYSEEGHTEGKILIRYNWNT